MGVIGDRIRDVVKREINKNIKDFLDYSRKEDAMLTSQLLASSNVKTDYVNRHSNPENLVN